MGGYFYSSVNDTDPRHIALKDGIVIDSAILYAYILYYDFSSAEPLDRTDSPRVKKWLSVQILRHTGDD